jgi:hypothetical protein
MSVVISDVMVKIAEANVMGRKYYEDVSDNYKSYLHFIVDVLKNPEKVAVIIGSKNGDNFLQDRETILLPLQYENDIINSFKKMIYKVYNNYMRRFPNCRTSEDEALSYCQESLRRAIWGYTDLKYQFSTYAYHGISSGMNDLRKIEFRKFKKNKELTNTINNKDEDSEYLDQGENYSFQEYKSKKYKNNSEYTVTNLVADVCKSDFERQMISIWLSSKRSNSEWISPCQECYFGIYGKSITEAGIREKFRRLKERMAKHAKTLNIRDVDILAE